MQQGKKEDDAEEEAAFAGGRKYTWNVDEMASLAKFGKKDERVGLEAMEAKEALHAVVDLPPMKLKKNGTGMLLGILK